LTAIFILCSPLKGKAESVTLTLENVGPGNQAIGVYTYPYDFSINGSTSYTSLMCVSYNEEIYFGESWTANVYSIAKADALQGTKNYEIAAWLFDDANVNTADNNADQIAAWGLFYPQTPSIAGASTQLSLAEAAISGEHASYFNQFLVFLPIAGTQPSNDGLPQSFLGFTGGTEPTGDTTPDRLPLSATPEPSSLFLLASGLLCGGGALIRRKRAA
jgi:hypothetical protein